MSLNVNVVSLSYFMFVYFLVCLQLHVSNKVGLRRYGTWQSSKKYRERKRSEKPKEEEGDRFGRDKIGKEKEKKNRPDKTEETGSVSTGEREHQQFFQKRW